MVNTENRGYTKPASADVAMDANLHNLGFEVDYQTFKSSSHFWLFSSKVSPTGHP